MSPLFYSRKNANTVPKSKSLATPENPQRITVLIWRNYPEY
jgi:hypothetical protein